MAPSFEDLKAEYADLWRRMQVRPEREAEVDRLARTLLGLKSRYDEVAHTTGVPWFVIAVLHRRESDGDFRTYLGNGEPLNRRTRIEPIGRGPFPTWEAGAIDALQFDGLDKVREWTPERACYEIEKFNGFGYRNKNVKSPYLWSFSNIYDRGKFVADHQFSFSAVDQQCGAMPILKRMMELDPSVRFEGATDVVMVDDGSLAMGSIGERVGQLQAGLAQLGFAVGDIDSEFGPITSAAVSAFQSAHGLPPTGIADQATQHALASALGQGPAGPTEPLKSQDILGALLSALLAKARAAPPRAPGPGPADAPGDVLQLILRALASGQPAPAPGGVAPPSVGNAPPVADRQDARRPSPGRQEDRLVGRRLRRVGHPASCRRDRCGNACRADSHGVDRRVRRAGRRIENRSGDSRARHHRCQSPERSDPATIRR
ncbi:MAG: peptidoglycan-binding protein, partial [Xanthobacteraceae bacterium]